MSNVKLRQELEARIARKAIEGVLAGNLLITVNDGEEDVLVESSDIEAIIKVMFSTDEDRLYVSDGKRNVGWIYFVYGNDGHDVINDYTTNLEPFLKDANELADSYS